MDLSTVPHASDVARELRQSGIIGWIALLPTPERYCGTAFRIGVINFLAKSWE